jgi:hypothetical protein
MQKIVLSIIIAFTSFLEAQQIKMETLSKTEKKIVERIEKNYNETIFSNPSNQKDSLAIDFLKPSFF